MSDPITQGIRRGAFVFGFLKAWRQNRRDRRAAKRGETVSKTDEESVSMFPKGTQTLSGIALLVLVPWAAKYGIESAQVETIVAAAGTLIGAVVGVLGYLRRKKLPAE